MPIFLLLRKSESPMRRKADKKTFDTTYRDKYIKILSQMISNPNKFEKMDYFEFTKWTRCFIFNELEN